MNIKIHLEVVHGGLFPLTGMLSVPVMTQDCTMMEDSYMETADAAASCTPPSSQEGSKLPPVLANLMVSLNSNRSPQAQSNTPPQSNNPAMNVQELLSSIMVRFPAHIPPYPLHPPCSFLYYDCLLRTVANSFVSDVFLGRSGV